MITKEQIQHTLIEAFPSFAPRVNESDLPYVVLGDFARFLLKRYQDNDEPVLREAARIIELLHTSGDKYVKEAATTGLLEGIQNTWPSEGVDPEPFRNLLGPVSQQWWDSLNRFWKKEIPFVGADIKCTEPGGGAYWRPANGSPNAHP